MFRFSSKSTLAILAFACASVLRGGGGAALDLVEENSQPLFPEFVSTAEGVYTPYSWVTLDALNSDPKYSKALAGTRSQELFELHGEVTEAGESDCSELQEVVDFNELLPARELNSLHDYLRNEGGVVSFTIEATKTGFYFGVPSTMLALRSNWASDNAEPTFVREESLQYAVVPKADVQFGDVTVCQRQEGFDELYEPGIRVLYFPRSGNSSEILQFHDRHELVVESADNAAQLHAPEAFYVDSDFARPGFQAVEDFFLNELEVVKPFAPSNGGEE